LWDVLGVKRVLLFAISYGKGLRVGVVGVGLVEPQRYSLPQEATHRVILIVKRGSVSTPFSAEIFKEMGCSN
jgi:hypothetical protein